MAIKLTNQSSYYQLISWFLISWPVILTLWSKEPNICYIFEKLVNHGYQIVTQLTLQIISWSANFWYAKETHKRLWWYISVNCMIIHCFCTHNVTVYIFTNQRLVLFFQVSLNFAAMLPKMNRLSNTYVLPI